MFFCRGAEETFSWRKYLNFAAKVNIWIVIELSCYQKKITALLIRAGSLKTVLQENRRWYITLVVIIVLNNQTMTTLPYSLKNSLDHFGSCGGIYCPWAVGKMLEAIQMDELMKSWFKCGYITPMVWNIWKERCDSNHLGGKYRGVHFYVFQSHGHKWLGLPHVFMQLRS